MNCPQPAVGFRGGSDAIQYFAGAVSGAIVDRNHFIVVVIELQERGKSWADVFFFIARRNNNADSGIGPGDWLGGPFGQRDVGYLGHAKRGIDYA